MTYIARSALPPTIGTKHFGIFGGVLDGQGQSDD